MGMGAVKNILAKVAPDLFIYPTVTYHSFSIR